ncbi:MAG: hypothetical protein J6C57_08045, partial [Paludibacteraceae bacterium]|nr:hypothetical protein [Paludibacteraceae bacterium]
YKNKPLVSGSYPYRKVGRCFNFGAKVIQKNELYKFFSEKVTLFSIFLYFWMSFIKIYAKNI